jgi:hypothetical protein
MLLETMIKRKGRSYACAPSSSIPSSIAWQPLLADPHRRQHHTGQFPGRSIGRLEREQLGESALEIVEFGAILLAEAEKRASIGSDDGQQPLLAVPIQF